MFFLIRIDCLEKIIRAVIHRVSVMRGVFKVSVMILDEYIFEWFSEL